MTKYPVSTFARPLTALWYGAWIAVCLRSSLNLSAVGNLLYFTWLFVTVTGCAILCLRDDRRRYATMACGFAIATAILYEGIVYVMYAPRGGVGAAVFVAFLGGTHGAIMGAGVLV